MQVGARVVPAPFTSHHKLCQNQFGEPNRHVLTFLHPICSVQDHIQSSAGDALKHRTFTETPGRKRTEKQGQKWNQKPENFGIG
jgi:hypothetical protein